MIGFVDSIVTCYKKSFTISGRASRAEFWWFILYFYLLCFIFAWLHNSNNIILEVPIGIVIMFSIIPTFTVRVRRLHDTDHSGWNILWGAIPYLGFIGAIYLLILECTSGDLGENDYGPNPYDEDITQIVQDAVSDVNEVIVEQPKESTNDLKNNQSKILFSSNNSDEDNKKNKQKYVNEKEKSPKRESSEWEEI